jgi:putative tricarboxylic transport membrane protein
MVLAIVLGDNAEASFRQAMLFSRGEMIIFFETPLVASITGLAFFLLFWPLIALAIRKLRGG